MSDAPPARVVLVCQDLIEAIATFQRGIYYDMRPFVTVANPWTHLRHSCVDEKDLELTTMAFAPFHDIVSMWYTKWGHERLPKLLACLPHLRDIVVSHAVFSGNLPVLQMLPEQTIQAVRYPLLDLAALTGRMDILDYLHAVVRHNGCTIWAIDKAAHYGHIDVVRYLHERRTEGCSAWAIMAAAKYGHLDVVKFLHAHLAHPCLKWALEHAAGANHVDIVKYIIESLGKDQVYGANAMNKAAHHGHVAMLELLDSHGLQCTTDAMDFAACCGHLDVVQWLHSNHDGGCTTLAMDEAARNGHLDVVRWLHTHRQEGCTKQAIHHSIMNKHWDVVRYLITHQLEGNGRDALDLAMHDPNAPSDVVALLRDKGAPVGVSTIVPELA